MPSLTCPRGPGAVRPPRRRWGGSGRCRGARPGFRVSQVLSCGKVINVAVAEGKPVTGCSYLSIRLKASPLLAVHTCPYLVHAGTRLRRSFSSWIRAMRRDCAHRSGSGRGGRGWRSAWRCTDSKWRRRPSRRCRDRCVGGGGRRRCGGGVAVGQQGEVGRQGGGYALPKKKGWDGNPP